MSPRSDVTVARRRYTYTAPSDSDMDSTLVAVLSLILVVATRASHGAFVLGLGKCPTVAAQSTLDKAQYLGVWYEYQRFPAIFEAGLDCTTATYGEDGDDISVTNAGTLRLELFGNKVVLNENSVEGSATIPDPAKPAELQVSFGGFDMGNNSPNYFIQATDYTEYAVVFSCSEFLFVNVQFAWILTRTPGVAPSNLATLKSNLQAAGVDVSNFKVIDQSGCPGR
ncbi:hypothetical protein RRG08_016850 [Elysia crispata]|uniref:Apolipoprotein D n=1 Tax=Elysia crispata TaxID=231223 RepID=A0AAE0XMG1_9GAST|nr:hypothetical protein RRG08_016850 [Elysia crispata]